MTSEGTIGPLAWVGPDPVRVDAAHVTRYADRMTARGTSAVADYALDWALDTASGWVTRRLSVRARGDDWSHSLVLERDGGGRWSADAHDLTGLGDALDCDLGLCPFTNTMPVLRHRLVEAARAGRTEPVDFTMAWVAVPELTVQASRQRYTPLGPAPDGGARIRYESGTFAADIVFDADGIVLDYPHLARRLRGGSRTRG
jgi:hypothetical protein